jgi:hypothetical protein
MQSNNRNRSSKPRDPTDHYPTPYKLARAACGIVPAPTIDAGRVMARQGLRVVDIGAGSGPWGRAVRDRFGAAVDELVGVDLRPDLYAPPCYDRWICQDAQTLSSAQVGVVDVVIGNPPYNIAESLVRVGLSLLRPGGYLCFLLRTEFLASRLRGQKDYNKPMFRTGRPPTVQALFHEFPLYQHHTCIQRPSYTGDGHTDAMEYAIFLWKRGYVGPYSGYWLDWKSCDYVDPNPPSVVDLFAPTLLPAAVVDDPLVVDDRVDPLPAGYQFKLGERIEMPVT